MREVTVVLSGAKWKAGLLFFLNPGDETKQGWFHVNLVQDGETLLSGYAKGRKTIKVTVDERVAQDLGL